MLLFQWIKYSEMPFLHRITGVIVSLLLLQMSITAADAVGCASASGRMGGVGSTMNRASVTMPDTPRPSSALAASATTRAPLDYSGADSPEAACMTMGPCTFTGNIPSTLSMELPRTPAGAFSTQPASMAQGPSPAPEVPPPRA